MAESSLKSFVDATWLSIDPVARFEVVIGPADPWQKSFLRSTADLITACCSRQVGKSTTTACLAYDAVTCGQFILILASAERQARELLRKVLMFRAADRHAPTLIRSTLTELEVYGGGRVVCVPASSDTLRGYSAADIVIIEEAAFCDDDAITAILPSRSDTGRVLLITTPGGSRACFFYQTMTAGGAEVIMARSTEIPRLAKKVAFDKKVLPEIRFRVEHELEWLSSQQQFISGAVIEAAFDETVSAMRL